MVRAARGDLSQEDFLAELGVKISQSQLSKIERGLYPPKPSVIRALAKRYDIDAEEVKRLIDRARGWPERDPSGPPTKIARSHTRKEGYLPVVGKTACGSWIEAIETGRQPHGEKRMEFVGSKIAAKKDAFMIEASGDSMTGSGINDGDLLLVEPRKPLVNGKIALVILGDEVTCKVWRELDDKVLLSPTNPSPKYKDLIVSKEEFAREGGRAYRVTAVQTMKEL